MKAPIDPILLLDKLSRSGQTNFRKGRDIMTDNPSQKITYQVGKITFVVTPVYQTGRSESIAAILLRLMKADAERV